MNIGVIGLGSIGERHVRNIQMMYPRFSIDILTQRSSWKDKGPRTRLTTSQKDFYSTKHDAYFVTNETSMHAGTVLTCLAQNPRGIFVEKPLCHTPRDIKRIRKALQHTNTVFFVGYCMQFSKPLTTIKKELSVNSIGEVLFLRASVGHDLREWRKKDYRKQYSADRMRGGGAILDLIHELNYPGWLLNEPIHFESGFSKTVHLPIQAEDISEGIFQTKGGAVVSIHQDYLQRPGRRYCEIIGTKGTLIWDSEDGIILRTEKYNKRISAHEDRNKMYQRELAHFIHTINSGAIYSNFDEAARDVQNAEALKRA